MLTYFALLYEEIPLVKFGSEASEPVGSIFDYYYSAHWAETLDVIPGIC